LIIKKVAIEIRENEGRGEVRRRRKESKRVKIEAV
jgi:hypothetical protein